MPITTIRQLPNTDTLRDDDLILVSSGGTSKNISWGQVKALLEGKKLESWMPTNSSIVYTTNIWSTTFVTNSYSYDLKDRETMSATVASVVPKPIFSVGQWWMISFGVIISIVCLFRIAAEWRWNKS